MRASAADRFYDEMVLLEGWTNWLYFDTHNPPLATTGVGNMIDTGDGLSGFGLSLPWRTKSGNYVRESTVAAEYERLKGLGISAAGGYAYKDSATLFLDQNVVRWMFDRTAASMEKKVSTYFPEWENWTADAQMAVMSGAWNMGPAFPESWPNLARLLNLGNWYEAAYAFMINDAPSDRNRRNRVYLLQASLSDYANRDPELFWGWAAVDLSKLIWAIKNPSSVGFNAWWTQAMLRQLAFYTGPLDGKFGPISQAAYRRFCESRKLTVTSPTLDNLRLLSNATLRLPVVS
jgi:hypothetical protein